MSETFAPALHPDEFLDVTPPWRHVLVSNRPVDRDAFLQVRFVVEVAPAENAATPHDRLAAHLAAANPRKRLALGSRIRVVEIVDEKIARVLVAGATLRLNRL